jgi:hypothetical protein
MNWNTLHIFGYGQVQLISNTENKLVDSNLCPSTQSVVDMIYSHKPQGNTASINYRTINVLNDLFADYQSEEGMFRTDYSELDSALLNQLASEIEAA